MRNACKCAFRDAMMKHFKNARSDKGLSQARFAELLLMDPRSYADLEKGASCCCALTLLLYLVFCCRDVQGFVDEMRQMILKVYEQHRNQEAG